MRLITVIISSLVLSSMLATTVNASSWNKSVILKPSDRASASVTYDFPHDNSGLTGSLKCTISNSKNHKAFRFILNYANHSDQEKYVIPGFGNQSATVFRYYASFKNTPAEGGAFESAEPLTFQVQSSYNEAGAYPNHYIAMNITNTNDQDIKVSCDSPVGRFPKLSVEKMESNFNHGN